MVINIMRKEKTVPMIEQARVEGTTFVGRGQEKANF